MGDDDTTMKGEHPDDELAARLAAYVDGTLGRNERARLERHLHSCAACRREAELATRGRAALASLPQLEAPTIAHTLELPEPAEVAPARARTTARWGRVGWAAGLAAAASLTALLVVHLTGGGRMSSSGAPGLSSEARAPVVAPASGLIARGQDYNAQSLSGLAHNLARAPDAQFGAAGSTTRQEPLYASSLPEPAPASPLERALSCARKAAGIDASVPATYAEAAEYNHAPAYVVAFVVPSGSRSYLELVVASRSGCGPLASVVEAR
jgi:hypothetical protein